MKARGHEETARDKRGLSNKETQEKKTSQCKQGDQNFQASFLFQGKPNEENEPLRKS